MTTESANALYRYFEVMYNLNRSLISLCGVDVMDNEGCYEKLIEEVILAIPRVIPYGKKKNTEKYMLFANEGLLEFADQMCFLRRDYERILQSHYEFLSAVKEIRNKLEHHMHKVEVAASGSGSINLFYITYELPDRDITLTADALLAFVEDMNVLYAKIQREVENFVIEYHRGESRYYRRLTRFSFSDFNEIFRSSLIRKIGKTMFSF